MHREDNAGHPGCLDRFCGDRIVSWSKQARWRSFGFCLRFHENCRQLFSVAQSTRPTSAQRGDFFPSRLTSSYKCMRDGAQRVTSVRAQRTRRTRVPLCFVLYPGITEKQRNPGGVRTERKSPPPHVFRDLVQITGDHQGDCTFQHAA